MVTEGLAVRYEDVEGAATRLHAVAHRTPVLTCRSFDQRTGCHAFFKCENFQRAGAFKFRGAYNALSRLSEDQRRRGVIIYSSGNHAQAIALAGQLLGVSTTVVMPSDAPRVKAAATTGYGAEVVVYEPALAGREEVARSLAAERGLELIPPFDHRDVIAGQGTLAKELFEEVGPLQTLLVCCGGGGLLSGCATAAEVLAPDCRVVGVEPAHADDATRSFHTGELQRIEQPQTIADGARTPALGTLTFPIVLARVDDMVTVSEDAILSAMFYLLERMKIVVEPTGAVAPAALLEGVVEARDQRVGVVLSGGNVDLEELGSWLRHLGQRSTP